MNNAAHTEPIPNPLKHSAQFAVTPDLDAEVIWGGSSEG